MQVQKQQWELGMEQWTGSKLGKEYIKAVYCHPAYLTYAEYIVWNTRLDEAQAGIKIARRNINNVRHADDTTLMAESEEELKSLLIKVKVESEKAGLVKVESEKAGLIKKNTFESVLMRWMKLEPIIQSEVSQKEKHQYSILTHIYGI